MYVQPQPACGAPPAVRTTTKRSPDRRTRKFSNAMLAVFMFSQENAQVFKRTSQRIKRCARFSSSLDSTNLSA